MDRGVEKGVVLNVVDMSIDIVVMPARRHEMQVRVIAAQASLSS